MVDSVNKLSVSNIHIHEYIRDSKAYPAPSHKQPVPGLTAGGSHNGRRAGLTTIMIPLCVDHGFNAAAPRKFQNVQCDRFAAAAKPHVPAVIDHSVAFTRSYPIMCYVSGYCIYIYKRGSSAAG